MVFRPGWLADVRCVLQVRPQLLLFVADRPAISRSNGVTETVQVRGPANYDGYGKIKGFEVAYQQTFDFLPKPLDGLGVDLNYSYIDSSGLPNAS